MSSRNFLGRSVVGGRPVRERHHDYQITIPTVPPGGLSDLSISLDSDAPFMLRMVKSRNLGPSGFMFQTASRQWQSSGFVTDLLAPQNPGDAWLPSRGKVIEPQLYYPVSSQIVLSVGNNTGVPLSNVRILFRGSKLFDAQAITSPTYPAKISVLPFVYQQVLTQVQTTDVRLSQPFNVRTDSDFALNWGVADPFDLATPPPILLMQSMSVADTIEEVYVMLRDESRKAYSNEPIHINDLFGQGIPTSYPSFSSPSTFSVNDPAVLQYPNRFSPSIYVQRNGALYLDVFRNEVQAGMGPVNLYFRYGGVKVFAR